MERCPTSGTPKSHLQHSLHEHYASFLLQYILNSMKKSIDTHVYLTVNRDNPEDVTLATELLKENGIPYVKGPFVDVPEPEISYHRRVYYGLEGIEEFISTHEVTLDFMVNRAIAESFLLADD